MTVNSVENMKSVGPSALPTNAKDTFVTVDVTGNKALTIDSNMFKLKSGGKSLEADSQGSMSANQNEDGSIENSFFLEQVNPDSTTQGKGKTIAVSSKKDEGQNNLVTPLEAENKTSNSNVISCSN
ncbi:Telomeric repeat-binding factor 2 [Staphylococcus saccharolyticus]|uniref:Telomeric repeat-binding factor 2 n=1 Tax=Staphylococcus saccharolyticus TaxID=33028 RepID=A0A380H6X5_9STAP|nr:Telomeric repeat-binding factor 2 [Staphylococcus saccharolyticus]